MADFNLQEECTALQSSASDYNIPNEIDIHSLDPEAISGALEGAIEAVANSSDAITDLEVFDVYRSLLKYSDALQGSTMSKLLDSICSGMLAELESTNRDVEVDDQHAFKSHKSPLEMYAFLIQWFVSSIEKVSTTVDNEAPVKPKKGKGPKSASTKATSKRPSEWTWADQIPPTLGLLSKVLRLKTHRIWTTTAERDAFINCITRPAYYITENETYMKSEKIRLAVYKVICYAVKHHGHSLGAQISIMQSLQYFEHLSEPMAEVLNLLESELDHTQLTDEILREVAAKNFNAQDTKGPRSFSRFLVRLSELSPKLVIRQISLLLEHLDSEAYPMRMAIVEVIGTLIKYIATTDDEKKDKKISSLFELLTERLLDLNSYVRAKVLNTLVKLCDLPQKFPKHRLNITELVVGSLEDKSSSVRRYAIALLTKLVLTHPYGLMHGGMLKLVEWEDRYNEVKKELEKAKSQPVDELGVLNEGEEATSEGEEDETQDEGDMTFRQEPRADEPILDEGLDAQSVTSTARKSRRAPSEAPESEYDFMDDLDENDGGQPLYDDDEDEDLLYDEDGGVPGSSPSKQSVRSASTVKRTPAKTPAKTPARTPARTPAKTKTPGKTLGKTPGKTPARSPKTPSKKKAKARKSETVNLAALSNAQVVVAEMQGNELVHLRLRKRYYAEALQFIRQIEGAADILRQLLGSTNKAEVLESMEFFRVAHEYQLQSAQSGIKQMLHLIWSKDNSSSTTEDGKELKGIRSRLLECYRSIYFDPISGLDDKQQVNRVAKNMIERTYDATLADLTSLEELMRTMINDDQIQSDVIAKLWHVYSTDKGIPKVQRRGAIIILGMVASAKRQIVTDRVDTLLRVGLGPLGKADLILARYTCTALQRLSGSVKKVKGSLVDKSVRLPMDNPIFGKLKDIIQHPCQSKDWFGMAEQAINAIYLLGEQPDLLCDELIKSFTKKVFSQPASQPSPEKPDNALDDDNATVMGAASPGREGRSPSQEDVGDVFHLSQLLFIVGHIAIKHIVYLELVERELKRRKDVSDKEKGRMTSSSPSKSAREGEELDQVAGNTEDDIGDLVASIREEEMLYSPNSLLTDFGPMVVHICGTPKMYKNQCLRTTATLTLSKLMCVSSKFCEANLLLLLKILETSKDPNIRSNIVIALGDIAVCFGTLIDENSDRLYKGLSDTNLVVKKNTLMVLTHLILNGMIKVKGQLGEMAKCLEDEDRRIADLAKLFFTELSTKDNAIYNNIQDVISHLTVGPHSVEEEVFQNTMKYIFSFIEKEKQAENLVEKLCQRFRDTEDEKQWRNTAYCLSLLPFKSDKSLKKLIEGLQFYRDKLREATVFARFSEILTKARANKSANKPDSEMREFEQILQEFKEQGEEDQALEKRVRVKKAQAKKRESRRKKATNS